MNNQFEFHPSVNNTKLEDVMLFGRLLAKRRNVIGKSARRVGLELGFGPNSATVSTWENGTTFPEVERLPKISEVYKIKGIELEELLRVFEISKEARRLQHETRFPPKSVPIKNPDTEIFIPLANSYCTRKTPSNKRRH